MRYFGNASSVNIQDLHETKIQIIILCDKDQLDINEILALSNLTHIGIWAQNFRNKIKKSAAMATANEAPSWILAELIVTPSF